MNRAISTSYCIVAVLLAASCAHATSIGGLTVSEAKMFALTQVSEVDDLAVGSDGRMWFLLPAAKAVGAVDRDGNIEMYQYPINIDAVGQQIASGPDGALWFTQVDPHAPVDSGPDMIGRLTTKGAWAEYPIASWDSLPQGIVAGPDGAMWFAERHANAIGRITMSGKIKEYPLPHAGSGPTGIALGRDRTLWFTETDGNRIGDIDPATGEIVEYSLPVAKSKPGPIAADLNADDVAIIELATHRLVSFDTVKHTFEETAVEQPIALAPGPWHGELSFIDASGRIGFWSKPGTRSDPLFDVASKDEAPSAIAVDPHGDLIWFAVRKGPTFAYAATGGVGYVTVAKTK